jgi:hypothetical protein
VILIIGFAPPLFLGWELRFLLETNRKSVTFCDPTGRQFARTP